MPYIKEEDGKILEIYLFEQTDRNDLVFTDEENLELYQSPDLLDAKKREAYRSESDPLYMSYQAALFVDDPSAEQKQQAWISKRNEIKARFGDI